ncbi:carbamoyltransferase HypF [Botryobacter ruber]|uniref:carbamoyltransferase HypF n=1 Tax=Botryobacter ruber TaxID=2171629 RepID=UPI000E0A298C|nr:carbamoyltransferase HypF [Botryobacter ruber]
MPTYAIHIAGQVQGIGFRPFVYRLATQLGLQGWVRNQADGVHIQVQGEAQQVQEFYEKLSTEAPLHTCIQAKTIERTADKDFDDFRILKEPSVDAAARLLLTPDLAMCESCRHEISDSHNRRFGYAFTTCTSCGPRYSLLAKLPYDREHTTMAPFAMCAACAQEYQAPQNRRYYSQTNSCPDCPINLALYDAQQHLVTENQQEVIAATVQLLREGKIVAVKGVGGFLLLADAANAATVAALRKRKHRPHKPFALMYPNLEAVLQDVVLHEEEQKLLLSPEAPIVLAQRKPQAASGIQTELIAPRMNRLGLLLPYAPLLELLLSEFQQPVVATSANSKGSHILYKNEEALEQLAGIADFVLLHNRDILMPQDDSVLQFTPKHRQRILLRRARGFAPAAAGVVAGADNFLALGADLKSTFAFTAGGNTCVSQYLGDLASYNNLLHFERCLAHLAHLLHFQPSHIIIDKHPGYASVQLGKQLARKYEIPVVAVQHHEAHFAAVLAENQLLNNHEPVLGVIWDGTGLGHDGLVRGGEFLLFQDKQMAALAQFEPYLHLLGDKMALEPRIAALALCHGLKGAEAVLSSSFTAAEWKLYQQLLQPDKVTLHTTSMGRIFDAAAALMGLCSRNSYEGEAAMALEAAAMHEPALFELPGYAVAAFNGKNLPVVPIFQQLLQDVQQGISQARMAAQFHVTLVRLVEQVASHYSLRSIAFSGGVFQNSLLVDLLLEKLSTDFQLYFHRQLPPNDECIAYGQLAWTSLQQQARQKAETPALEEKHQQHHL